MRGHENLDGNPLLRIVQAFRQKDQAHAAPAQDIKQTIARELLAQQIFSFTKHGNPPLCKAQKARISPE